MKWDLPGLVVALAVAGLPGIASATCKQIGRRRAVCSSPDGDSYTVKIDPPSGERTPRFDWREVRERQAERWRFEGAAGPFARMPIANDPPLGVAVGGDVSFRALYGFRPKGASGFSGRLARGAATAVLGDRLGARVTAGASALLGPERWGSALALRVGSLHQVTAGRFWVPAFLSVLPAVGVHGELGGPTHLELSSELPFGVLLADHVGLELRPGVSMRRAEANAWTPAVSVAVSLVLF